MPDATIREIAARLQAASETVVDKYGRHAEKITEDELTAEKRAFGGRVLHPLQVLQEPLGTVIATFVFFAFSLVSISTLSVRRWGVQLLQLILLDPDGHEICLVSKDSFEAVAKAATDYRLPDWEARDKTLASIFAGNEEL